MLSIYPYLTHSKKEDIMSELDALKDKIARMRKSAIRKNDPSQEYIHALDEVIQEIKDLETFMRAKPVPSTQYKVFKGDIANSSTLQSTVTNIADARDQAVILFVDKNKPYYWIKGSQENLVQDGNIVATIRRIEK